MREILSECENVIFLDIAIDEFINTKVTQKLDIAFTIELKESVDEIWKVFRPE